ncbi:MAG: DUF4363 family protein [Clostridia bacterium]|nr:DUF4363 family protein [Clostridia bacterium]
MKRFAIAVFSLLFTITFSIGNYFLVCNKVDTIISIMEKDRHLTLYEGKADEKRINEITETWKKHEVFLVSMMTHHELEDVEIGVQCLNDYVNQEFTHEYIKTLNECINKLEHIKETQLPDIKNIF